MKPSKRIQEILRELAKDNDDSLNELLVVAIIAYLDEQYRKLKLA